VDKLKRHAILDRFPDPVRTAAAQLAAKAVRKSLRWDKELDEASLSELLEAFALGLMQTTMTRAINLSGVVLHTGLGRARLHEEVADAIAIAARDHACVELDRQEGTRGDRQSHVAPLLNQITGAEASYVVNNCAAAVFLALTALCKGAEVILSRGQMVEIGGSFRMPEIVKESGCTLIEVGCTNKTRLSDYEDAITAQTAAILRCHPSNFAIVGFHSEPSRKDLVNLARKRGILLIDDLGSGCVLETTQFGIPSQPKITDAVADGAHLVLSSGDKLLGGPQAGLICGEKACIDQLRSHPLARALRVDKLTLAGLEVTLRLYTQGREREIPTWRAIARPIQEVKKAAAKIAAAWPGGSVEKGTTEVGGGAAPAVCMDTWLARLPSKDEISLLQRLRKHSPAIIGRILGGAVVLDPRTATDAEIGIVRAALREFAAE